MIAGIILAAGKGTRMKSEGRNKTAVLLAGKPLVVRAVELLEPVVDKIVVVVGAYEESVRKALIGKDVMFAKQTKRLGTGHAARVGLRKLEGVGYQAESVVVGYGDHMMFYTPRILREMVLKHESKGAAVTLVSTTHEEPNYLAWGRVVRDGNGFVERIVEQKEATRAEKLIKEVNAGFYCLRGKFASECLGLLPKSNITGEYYLTDMMEMARARGERVVAHGVAFENVGYGINTPKHLSDSEELFLS